MGGETPAHRSDPGLGTQAVVVLGCITILILAIAARTIVALIHHQFLPAAHPRTNQSLHHSSGFRGAPHPSCG